jgi:hypothetical protein
LAYFVASIVETWREKEKDSHGARVRKT